MIFLLNVIASVPERFLSRTKYILAAYAYDLIIPGMIRSNDHKKIKIDIKSEVKNDSPNFSLKPSNKWLRSALSSSLLAALKKIEMVP